MTEQVTTAVDVVVPFTMRIPEVERALEVSGYPYRMVDVSSDDEAYWRLLCELWEARETFVVVEHDIVVGPDTIKELEACAESWCAARYSYRMALLGGLGCTKFSFELMREFPRLPIHAATSTGTRHWSWLDMSILRELRCLGFVEGPCRRHAAVRHLGRMAWPGFMSEIAKENGSLRPTRSLS